MHSQLKHPRIRSHGHGPKTACTAVLQALFAAGPDERLYGLELMEQTGLKSGTLYPVLARLERSGWVISTWEEIDPQTAGRPRRRYYKLSGLGQRAGAAELSKFAGLPQSSGKPPRAAPTSPRPVWGQA
jgi:PadR family transcriptional regulator PadR